MTNKAALIVGAPGRLRDGVQALLLASPVITAVELADSELAAVKAVRNRCPALAVVIMSRLDDGIPAILRWIKVRCASSRFLIISSNAHLESTAIAAGANRFALIGTAAPHLAEGGGRAGAGGGRPELTAGTSAAPLLPAATAAAPDARGWRRPPRRRKEGGADDRPGAPFRGWRRGRSARAGRARVFHRPAHDRGHQDANEPADRGGGRVHCRAAERQRRPRGGHRLSRGPDASLAASAGAAGGCRPQPGLSGEGDRAGAPGAADRPAAPAGNGGPIGALNSPARRQLPSGPAIRTASTPPWDRGPIITRAGPGCGPSPRPTGRSMIAAGRMAETSGGCRIGRNGGSGRVDSVVLESWIDCRIAGSQARQFERPRPAWPWHPATLYHVQTAFPWAQPDALESNSTCRLKSATSRE